MKDPRPAPPVTITGGPGSAASDDLLGPESAPERTPGPTRRRRTPLALAAVLLLSVLGVAELRERSAAEEAARAEAERERSAVELALSPDTSGSTSYEPGTDSVRFRVLLRVRNAGPRKVTITAVDLPGVQLLAPAPLDVGRERSLTLTGLRSCRDDLAGLLDLDQLPLEVRTDAGVQQAELRFEGTLLYGDAIRRACGLSRPGLS